MAIGLFVEVSDRASELTAAEAAGTGNMQLAGALPGFATLGSAVGSGIQFCYEVHAVDANHAPTGEWETGLGVVTSAVVGGVTIWTLSRHICLDSSKVGGPTGPTDFLNFAAGTKQVSLSMVASALKDRKIFAPYEALIEFFVRADGSDTNTGLANTAAGAFATLEKAVLVARKFRKSRIKLGAGSFGAAIIEDEENLYLEIIGSGYDVTTINGVVVSGNNVEVNVSSTNSPYIRANGATCRVRGEYVGFTTSASDAHAEGLNGGTVILGDNIVYGDAPAHLSAKVGGKVLVFGETFFSVNATFSGAFAQAPGPHGVIGVYGTSVPPINLNAKTVSGVRYLAERCSVIDTLGSGGSYYPGSDAGVTSSGGQYL